jgi:hypothetical protein
MSETRGSQDRMVRLLEGWEFSGFIASLRYQFFFFSKNKKDLLFDAYNLSTLILQQNHVP